MKACLPTVKPLKFVNNMKNLTLPWIQQLKSYQPPIDNRHNFPGLLLDFNERTTPPSGRVVASIKQFLSQGQLQVYPEYFDLVKKIARYAKAGTKNIILTNGADQAIDLVFRAFTKPKDEVIIPSPSFAMFFQSAGVQNNKIISPLYRPDLSFPTDEVLKKINSKTKLIVICSPNNPTGTVANKNEIIKIATRAKSSIILIDEAYFEFCGQTSAQLIKQYPNIIISRTFSKVFGLGGLRIGYLIADPIYINELLKVRGPYDINILACLAASAAIDNTRYVKQYRREVMRSAKPLVENFFEKNKIIFYPSQSNFLLFKPDNPRLVYELLLKNGIRVRPQNKPPIIGTLRLTIGTVRQMKQFIKIYQTKIIKQKYALLDRDGVLIYEPADTYQIDSLDKLKILPEVITGLRWLIKNNYKLIMITNQDGLGTKSFPRKNFTAVQNKLLKIFKNKGIIFEKIFICPHFPEDNCACHKPKTGLVNKFLRQNKNKINLQNSFYCGDRESDWRFAKNIGCRYLPIKTNGSFAPVIKKLKI